MKDLSVLSSELFIETSVGSETTTRKLLGPADLEPSGSASNS